MSLADQIRQWQLGVMKAEDKKSARLREYKDTLRRYGNSLPEILFNAGLTHEEVSVLTSSFKSENFPFCQHLLMNAYENRNMGAENKSRIYSLALDISLFAQYKQNFI